MRNFQYLGSVNVTKLAHAVYRQPELWNQNDIRSTYPGTPHAEVDDIILRWNVDKDIDGVINGKECCNQESYLCLPGARELVFDLMRFVEGEQLGRLLITRIKPGGAIEPHEDMGASAEYYDRYHIVLQGEKGNMFYCDTEQVQMLTGEVWWFDNKKTHSAVNNSATDRIHMIIDIRGSNAHL